MPSRKVISIFIVSLALVATIIIISPSTNSVKSRAAGIGGIGHGPQIQIEGSTEWQEDYKEFGIEISESASSTETLTDEFSRSLMANFLSLKQSGDYDSTSAANLLDKSNEFINNSSSKTSFSLKDIVTSPDNSLTALTKYGNDLGQALKINKPKEIKNEVEIFGKMLETQDASLAIQIKNVAEIYNATVISLSNITVPSSLVNEHLKFINGLKVMAESTSNFAGGIDDPLKSTNSITEYNTAFDTMIEARANIQNSLLKSGVHYKQGDPAFFLYFGI